jgi:hypothetical protein
MDVRNGPKGNTRLVCCCVSLSTSRRLDLACTLIAQYEKVRTQHSQQPTTTTRAATSKQAVAGASQATSSHTHTLLAHIDARVRVAGLITN